MPKIVAILAVFVGYTEVYYGITQVQGGNWGVLDLVLPSRWNSTVAATQRDGGGNPGVTSANAARKQLLSNARALAGG